MRPCPKHTKHTCKVEVWQCDHQVLHPTWRTARTTGKQRRRLPTSAVAVLRLHPKEHETPPHETSQNKKCITREVRQGEASSMRIIWENLRCPGNREPTITNI
ncbi:hypothetical protein DQ04_02881050 [Trypanosoma grayi]|uniref:hypothetical protein n=1 Tax=Trypanosoma grayi TaxID=71804 RepID=UPI0004F4B6DE|nr:hypothetical protein DQ04_02881050 [Trypanosoma grayi]KEG11186.1 hypothetical protein DQ04_02881050 [Trypanosoma grayi]